MSGSDVTLIKFDTFEIKTKDSGILLIALAFLFYIVALAYSARTGRPIFKIRVPTGKSYPQISKMMINDQTGILMVEVVVVC